MIEGYYDAYRTQAEAFRVFERWQAEHDPDGELGILEAVAAYYDWAASNSIEKYLDSNALPNGERA